MKEVLLDADRVLAGYDAVARMYPFVPSLSHWRAWEYAAYQRYRIAGSVLDLGCGDGQYFRLLWPDVRDVTGVDASEPVIELARRSGVYTRVHHAFAHELPVADASADAVFANCSLEHMDHLDQVLAEIRRCLVPGGTLLCSVVTDRFLSWSVLPMLVREAGGEALARQALDQFIAYHHLVNPLTVGQWQRRFTEAGFTVEEHVPILPLYNSGLFLLADGAWHVKQGDGELGDSLYRAFSANPGFTAAFRLIVEGLLRMETDWRTGSGAVFAVRKAH
ncbi:class I SAM-dependent methyltransferase [Usitatibacter palustris]|uniref:2-methoxy-6-polyprenyl-1,4-benzoquinol methylase, mitochondrial n=1 Tax=Usitatibacter palustris TaxID=2732487 RepID=A0A6M4HA53_9PROT|nr:class I SAM-dependent methyltransferase [Usitatibacter palustris]QJR16490.1 2-methoxy-6-polyprenyl-1,4-benzoquinol methylase, mitochondrial [Usitatibacter palustris]